MREKWQRVKAGQGGRWKFKDREERQAQIRYAEICQRKH